MIKRIEFSLQVNLAIRMTFVMITITTVTIGSLTLYIPTAIALTTPHELQLQAQAASQSSGQQVIKAIDSIGSRLNQSRHALQNGDMQTGLLYLDMAEKNLTSLRTRLSNATSSQTLGISTTPGVPSASFSSSSPLNSSSQLPPQLPPGPPPPPPSLGSVPSPTETTQSGLQP